MGRLVKYVGIRKAGVLLQICKNKKKKKKKRSVHTVKFRKNVNGKNKI